MHPRSQRSVPFAGLPVQPIQPWQLADAQHAARLSESRLAEAEHAFSREVEELHTTIAAHEHSARVREANIRNLRTQLDRANDDLKQAKREVVAAINTGKQRLSECASEYSAETNRMREVVANHQRSAAVRDAKLNELESRLTKSESALALAQKQNEELTSRLEELAKTRQSELDHQIAERDREIGRLRAELGDTETQHKSDVERLKSEIDELRPLIAQRDRTIADLDLLCDRRHSEQNDTASRCETLQQKVRELEATIQSKQTELDEVVEMSEAIDGQLSEAVARHTEEVANFRSSIATKDEEVNARQQELRELATRLVQRETEFKTQLDDAKRSAEARLSEVTAEYQIEVERLSDTIQSLEEADDKRDAMIYQLNQEVARLQKDHSIATEQIKSEALLSQQEIQASLGSKLKQVQLQLQETESERDSIALKLESTEQDLHEAIARINGLEENRIDQERLLQIRNEQQEQLQQRDAEVARYIQQIGELKGRCEANAIDASTIEELSEQQTLLRSQLSDRDAQVADYVNQVNELRAKLDAQAQQQQTHITRVEELESQIVEVQVKKGEAENTAKQLEEQLFKNQTKYKQEKNELNAKVSHLTANTKQLQAAVKQKTETASQFAKTANLLRKDMNKLEVNRPGQNAKSTNDADEKQELIAVKKKLTQQLEENKSLTQQLQSLKATHQEVLSVAEKRSQELSAIHGESKKLKQEVQQLSQAKGSPQNNTAKVYRERLTTLKHYYNVLMQRCQRAEFAATQLDRTIAWLEQNSSTLQSELQRETAARRKAELANGDGDGNSVTLSADLANRIDLDEQIKRLTRELEATQKIRMIERQQAEAELKRIRIELREAKLQQRKTKRAA